MRAVKPLKNRLSANLALSILFQRVKELLHAKCFTGSTDLNPLTWTSLCTAFREEAGSEQSGDLTQVTQQEREEVKDKENGRLWTRLILKLT